MRNINASIFNKEVQCRLTESCPTHVIFNNLFTFPPRGSCILQRAKLSRPSYDWAPPHPIPPLSLQQVVSLSQSSCVSRVELTQGVVVAKYTTARKPVPYKSFNTLCFHPQRSGKPGYNDCDERAGGLVRQHERSLQHLHTLHSDCHSKLSLKYFKLV
jgi:hypothetical protein